VGSGQIALPSGFEVVEVGYSDIYPLAEEICRHAADVVVLDPPDLRKAVLAGPSAVAEKGRPL
jgi:proteasome accessory factor B